MHSDSDDTLSIEVITAGITRPLCVECLRATWNLVNFVEIADSEGRYQQVRKPPGSPELIEELSQAPHVRINNMRVGWFAVTMLRGNLVCYSHGQSG